MVDKIEKKDHDSFFHHRIGTPAVASRRDENKNKQTQQKKIRARSDSSKRRYQLQELSAHQTAPRKEAGEPPIEARARGGGGLQNATVRTIFKGNTLDQQLICGGGCIWLLP